MYRKTYAFRLLDQYRRFLESARLLLCEFEYTPEQLRDITLDLLRREGWRERVTSGRRRLTRSRVVLVLATHESDTTAS